jgi:ribonuclease P protein subunit RPR2
MINIAKERIDTLFKLADAEFHHHPERSHRYVELARNIVTKYNIRMPKIWRRRFCKNCHLFLKPGINARIRLQNSCVLVRCFECDNIMKIPYIKEKKGKRRRKVESYQAKKGADE